MAPSHGPQFDEFRGDSGNPHNGAQADTGYGTRGAEPHGGLLFDESFTAATVNTTHGARWDDFGWKQMPFGHGARYDANFSEPVAGNPEHGTWHDVFRGGATQARLIVDGKDVEAMVVRTHDGHGEALTRDGRSIEFMLSQVTGWKRANETSRASEPVRTAASGDTAEAMGVVTRPTASAPERGSQAEANGGGRIERAVPEHRTAETVKTTDVDVDVAKRGSAYGVTQGAGKMRVAVGPFCHGCAKVVKKALSGSSMATHPHVGTCRSCGSKVGKTEDQHDDIAKTLGVDELGEVIAKEVDATETAVQRKDGVGHRTGCPRGGDGACGPEQGGRCTTCNLEVRDHQALGKTRSLDDVLKTLRGLAS